MAKNCCVPNCRKTRSDGVILHVFPNPETEPKRFREWVYSIGGDILVLENKKIFRYRKVCHNHFENKYYTASKRLAANSVPTLDLKDKIPGTGLVLPHRMSLVGAVEERECAHVKEEPAEEKSVEEELYAGHEVKDELMIGPERLQPPDSAFAATDTAPGTGLVTPNRMSLVGVAEEGESVSVKKEPVEEWSAEEDLYAGHEVKDELVIGPARLQPPDYIPVVHTGEKPFKCSHCSYKSSHKHVLLVHERTHTGEKPFKCSHCSYKSSQKHVLLVHERTHTGEKPFKCSHCSYKSSQKHVLLVHERTHTGEKPFECSHCSYTSSQKSHLLRHERTHTGDKPFKCSHCSYTSSYKHYLLTHERTHTGEKPYKCDICDYKATRTSSLKQHVKRIHTQEKQTL